MTRARTLAAATLAMALLSVTAAVAAPSRAGHAEILVGLGSLTGQTASIDGFSSLRADDGTTFDLRFQLHFTNNLGIQVEGMGERERTHLETPGFFPVSDDTTTRFFLVNALFNLTDGPISPFVAVGVGSFSHRGILLFDQNGFPFRTTETGSVFDAAVGIEAHTSGPLLWAFEARYLYYEFSDFQDAWNRYQFSGHLGFRF